MQIQLKQKLRQLKQQLRFIQLITPLLQLDKMQELILLAGVKLRAMIPIMQTILQRLHLMLLLLLIWMVMFGQILLIFGLLKMQVIPQVQT